MIMMGLLTREVGRVVSVVRKNTNTSLICEDDKREDLNKLAELLMMMLLLHDVSY